MEFRSLTSWPGERTKVRKRATFSAGYARTLQDLDRELVHLNAREVVIQADCDDSDIRLDGRIRSSAKMRGPGIILSFISKHGPLSYPCDTYEEWTDNLRAIALALAALRAVDRYGVTKRAEQYRGWKQLPEAIQAEAFASLEQAARFLIEASIAPKVASTIDVQACIQHDAVLRAWWKDAAKLSHPDAGGSAERMTRINAAKDFIERHRGQA